MTDKIRTFFVQIKYSLFKVKSHTKKFSNAICTCYLKVTYVFLRIVILVIFSYITYSFRVFLYLTYEEPGPFLEVNIQVISILPSNVITLQCLTLLHVQHKHVINYIQHSILIFHVCRTRQMVS